jgi:spermidine/putrescine transport system ATP-binding protein
VNYPSALLHDEPLGALDLKLRQAMQIELKRIQREVGITFIYVTHDQEEALTMSDRIAVMNEGLVEQIGSPEDIYHSPSSVFVANFIGVANLLPATVHSNSGSDVTVLVGGNRLVRVDGGARQWAVGDAATVMVRPERLHLSRESNGATALPTVVDAVLFQGSSIRCILKTADGIPIVAHVGHDAPLPGLDTGQSLWVSWDADAARLLPPSKTPSPLELTLASTAELATGAVQTQS